MADDLLIVGGGVIGLSLAYELAGHGLRVRVVDRASLGREASWAGAGILPPARCGEHADAAEQLAALSFDLLPRWSAALREQTGIDNGYRRCGGLYVATTPEEVAALEAAADDYRRQGVRWEWLSDETLVDCEPQIDRQVVRRVLRLSDEAQIRNPWHLKALVVACQQRGVTLEAGCEVEDFETAGDRAVGVMTSRGRRPAGAVCVATGAWSRGVARRLGIELALKPMRGQIVLLAGNRRLLRHVVNRGRRYVVPRLDGRVLIGSTEEDVGFDKQTTAAAVYELLRMATDLVPALGTLAVERCWAGLRPWTEDGLPYLGRAPRWENVFVATGHFRAGLTLSPATAVVMGQLIRGLRPQIDLSLFDPSRATAECQKAGR